MPKKYFEGGSRGCMHTMPQPFLTVTAPIISEAQAVKKIYWLIEFLSEKSFRVTQRLQHLPR